MKVLFRGKDVRMPGNTHVTPGIETDLFYLHACIRINTCFNSIDGMYNTIYVECI